MRSAPHPLQCGHELGVFWSDPEVREVQARDVYLLLEAAAYKDLEERLEKLKYRAIDNC